MGTIYLQNMSVKEKDGKYIVKVGGGSTNTWDSYGRRSYESGEGLYETAKDAVYQMIYDWQNTRTAKASWRVAVTLEMLGGVVPHWNDEKYWVSGATENWEKDLKDLITDSYAEKFLEAWEISGKKMFVLKVSNFRGDEEYINFKRTSRRVTEYKATQKTARKVSLAEVYEMKAKFGEFWSSIETEKMTTLPRLKLDLVKQVVEV